MLEFFHTKARLQFLLRCCLIGAPILIAVSFVVSMLEDSSAAQGEPNDKGGLHYRIRDSNGTRALPPPLAAVVGIPAKLAMTDVDVDTDRDGHLAGAAIQAYSSDDFGKVAAFYKPGLNPVTRETATQLWGVRDGYEVKIDQGRRRDEDPYKDRIKVEYYVSPAEAAKP
jgi:hypothetical protein